MKQVAKVVIIDHEGYYLLLKRAKHPVFLNDPDLPGGTIEDGEEPLQAALREVIEEANVSLNAEDVEHLYTGNGYSAHGTEYSLYAARTKERPAVALSWEHASFEWMDRNEFLAKIHHANDSYMRMVHDVVNNYPV